jgi:hypothetical protein
MSWERMRWRAFTVSGEKITISSRRFRNSGVNRCRVMSITCAAYALHVENPLQ